MHSVPMGVKNIYELMNYHILKAELLQEGISFTRSFICQRRFSNKTVGNQKTKPTFIISVLNVEY